MFGWFKKQTQKPAPAPEWTEYKGYRLAATPIPEGGQFRVSGQIEKGEGDALQTHTFVRADLIASEQEAKDFSLKKGQLMIDQLGDRVFEG